MKTIGPFEVVGCYAVHRFGSVREFIEHGDNGPYRDRHRSASQWTFGSHFQTFDQTREALLDGRTTPNILKMAGELRDKILTAMDAGDTSGWSVKRRPVWSDYGDEADPDRVLERHDRPWRTSQRGKRARVIRLCINFALSAGNSEESFSGLVGTAAAIADTISRLGHGLEIIGALAVSGPWNSCYQHGGTLPEYGCWTFPVKSAGEPLDIERVGGLGLPGLLRSIGFRAMQASADCCESYGCCYVKEDDLKTATGTDYLITQSWFGMEQMQLFQGLAGILGEELES